MNIIRNQLKNLLVINQNLIQFQRNCTKYPELPKEWVMPVKICSVEPEKTGDGGLDYKINPSDYIQHFEKSNILPK
jgi:hypothetical protein